MAAVLSSSIGLVITVCFILLTCLSHLLESQLFKVNGFHHQDSLQCLAYNQAAINVCRAITLWLLLCCVHRNMLLEDVFRKKKKGSVRCQIVGIIQCKKERAGLINLVTHFLPCLLKVIDKFLILCFKPLIKSCPKSFRNMTFLFLSKFVKAEAIFHGLKKFYSGASQAYKRGNVGILLVY